MKSSTGIVDLLCFVSFRLLITIEHSCSVTGERKKEEV